jgi:Tol biopolymer transport system component
LAISILYASALLSAASGPDSRQPTEPKSVASPANPAAQPISIADLFYSRQIVPGSWSPDGREVVFSTNITGRLNLWKVNSAGGWPIQLSQSDDRQDRASFSPDGKWIVYGATGVAGQADIFVMRADGTGARAVTHTKTWESAPDWGRAR